jgi:hypothetical protein
MKCSRLEWHGCRNWLPTSFTDRRPHPRSPAQMSRSAPSAHRSASSEAGARRWRGRRYRRSCGRQPAVNHHGGVPGHPRGAAVGNAADADRHDRAHTRRSPQSACANVTGPETRCRLASRKTNLRPPLPVRSQRPPFVRVLPKRRSAELHSAKLRKALPAAFGQPVRSGDLLDIDADHGLPQAA